MTQANLGIAYRHLAGIEDRAGNLRRAVGCYEAALTYCTPETAPPYYATMQMNLGNAHKDLGDLPAALACWREAERYYRQMDMVADANKMLRWIADAQGGGAGEDDG